MVTKIKWLFLGLCCLLGRIGYAQDVIWEGRSTGENMYILNPGEEPPFCIKSIRVNGRDFEFDTMSNAFEISCLKLGIKPMDVVTVDIMLKDTLCQPVLVNLASLSPIREFKVNSLSYTKRLAAVSWQPQELDTDAVYYIQQYIFGRWQNIKDLGSPNKMINPEVYPVLCSGDNYFRLYKLLPDSNVMVSQKLKVKMPVKLLSLEVKKIKKKLELPIMTHYEIIDAEGLVKKSGMSQVVDMSDMPKGLYWVHFDIYQDIILKR